MKIKIRYYTFLTISMYTNHEMSWCFALSTFTLIAFLQLYRDSVPLSFVKQGAAHRNLCRLMLERNKRGAAHRYILHLSL